MKLTWPGTHSAAMRTLFAALVTVAAIGAFVTRSDEVVSWSILAPTVATFWLWVLSPRFAALPMYFLGFSAPIALNIVESDAEISMAIAVVTAVILATYTSVRLAVGVILATFMFVTSTLGVVEAIDDFSWPLWLLGICIAWAVGEALWRFSTAVTELEHTRSLVSDQATLQERRRIARDVHDLVGHSLTVVLLHLAGARHLVHTDPEEAERALEQAEAAGRESLAEIRRTVGLLRDETDSGVAPAPSSDLGDLSDLVNDFAAAGLDAHLEVSGPVGAVDPTVALAGYRIAQEALTNASRHTLGAEVIVSVSIDDDRCEITVVNRGGETIDLGKGTGFGLVSMRERARSVGGSLVAGPTRDGWTVDASLPIEPARTSPRESTSSVPAAQQSPAITPTSVATWSKDVERYVRHFLVHGCLPELQTLTDPNETREHAPR